MFMIAMVFYEVEDEMVYSKFIIFVILPVSIKNLGVYAMHMDISCCRKVKVLHEHKFSFNR